jgi:hypothetical protein
VPFDKLPPQEKAYNLSSANETLRFVTVKTVNSSIYVTFCCRTLDALGYHISYDPQFTSNTRLKTMKLPQRY